MSSYLNATPGTPVYGIEALKLWLKGDITTPNFLISHNGSYTDAGGRDTFTMTELHRALYLGILEISNSLDAAIEFGVAKASGEIYGINVEVEEFWEGRDAEVKSLVDIDMVRREERVREYDRNATCEVLEQVKEEIGWLENEGRRLDVHMEIAEMLKRAKLRRRFVFRPLARGWAVGKRVRDVEMGERDVEVAEEGDSLEVQVGEDEDEMLDVGDGVVDEESLARARRRREERVEEQGKAARKERLELFKREADVGFGTEQLDTVFEEEGQLHEANDSPMFGEGDKEEKDKKES